MSLTGSVFDGLYKEKWVGFLDLVWTGIGPGGNWAVEMDCICFVV